MYCITIQQYGEIKGSTELKTGWYKKGEEFLLLYLQANSSFLILLNSTTKLIQNPSNKILF